MGNIIGFVLLVFLFWIFISSAVSSGVYDALEKHKEETKDET